jgi:hypothetical protein
MKETVTTHEWKEIKRSFIIVPAGVGLPGEEIRLPGKTTKNAGRARGDETTEAYPFWLRGFF